MMMRKLIVFLVCLSTTHLAAFLLLFTLSGLTATGAAMAAEAPSAGLAVGVEYSMPVLGQPCRLWLVGDSDTDVPKLEDLEVTFRISRNDEKLVPLNLSASADAGDSIASVRWNPQRTGKCRISARVTYRDSDGGAQQLETSSVNVFVTLRRLHFNYWQCRPEQHFVTSVMDNSETTEAAIHWKRRGVRPLGWQGGQWHWARGYDSPEKMAKLWADFPKERVGIVIDEFGGGDEIDQQLGDALRLTRKQMPKMFLAPYCLSVRGQKMIDGYRQADLVLVETYTPDWRWDGLITGRWKTAVDAGLAKKSIAVLGLGSQWIGTERELRRVFRMVRTTCPEMPGIGFFPDVPRRLTGAVDSAIEDYFLRPVVEARVHGNEFTVRNIGETQATNVEVNFLDREGKRVSESKLISRLKPWTDISGALPPGAVTTEIAAAPHRYTALSYTPPLELPKPDADQRRASLQFRKRIMSGTVSNPLERAGEVTLVRTDDSDTNPDNHKNVRSASVPIRATGGKAVALSFDVRPNRCWFYGRNSISLIGDGELTLTWSRQDHDAGIEGNQPRPELVFKGKDEYVVRDVPAMGFSENETHRVLLAYDGHEAVRAIVTDQQDAVLWDSGPLPARGGFSCSKLRFDVNPFPRSEIRCDVKKSEVFLRGGGGDSDSPYWLESRLANLKLVTK